MMAKSAEQTHQTEVTLVPTDRIRVLNPRVRNPRPRRLPVPSGSNTCKHSETYWPSISFMSS